MDEIEFKRAYQNLRVLIDAIGEHPGDHQVNIHIRNAMLTITAMLDGLNQRITDMCMIEDDDE